MANHVTNILEIEYDPSDTETERILQKLIDLEEDGRDLSEMYESSENTRTWWENNIGAKWAYVEDWDGPKDGYCRVNIVSAWAQVTEFVEHLNEITQFSCDITHQYLDEMPNFGGYAVYKKGTIVKEFDEPDMWARIEEESELRMKEENLSFDDDREEHDWRWDWMWDFAYGMIEPEEG